MQLFNLLNALANARKHIPQRQHDGAPSRHKANRWYKRTHPNNKSCQQHKAQPKHLIYQEAKVLLKRLGHKYLITNTNVWNFRWVAKTGAYELMKVIETIELYKSMYPLHRCLSVFPKCPHASARC